MQHLKMYFMQTVEVLEGVKHISEALQSKESFDVESDWKTLLGGRWKSLGESMKNSRVPGLPPPFARKADAPRDPAKLAAMVLQSSDGQGVRTWRRKLFHFPADGNRPPFYGSFSRHRCVILSHPHKYMACESTEDHNASRIPLFETLYHYVHHQMQQVLCSRIVGARKVFLKDPNLDYEIMSDEEWEEEPEGEDIIDNDAEDEEGGMDEEEDEDGSFMVAGAAILIMFCSELIFPCVQRMCVSQFLICLLFQCWLPAHATYIHELLQKVRSCLFYYLWCQNPRTEPNATRHTCAFECSVQSISYTGSRAHQSNTKSCCRWLPF